MQAASIPYVGLTAWAALTMTAGLNLDWKTNHSKQKILVFGASGGVGTFAVQLLKACNYSVSDITLLPISEFVLDEKFQRNGSKFAIFFVFHFVQLYVFT